MCTVDEAVDVLKDSVVDMLLLKEVDGFSKCGNMVNDECLPECVSRYRRRWNFTAVTMKDAKKTT